MTLRSGFLAVKELTHDDQITALQNGVRIVPIFNIPENKEYSDVVDLLDDTPIIVSQSQGVGSTELVMFAKYQHGVQRKMLTPDHARKRMERRMQFHDPKALTAQHWSYEVAAVVDGRKQLSSTMFDSVDENDVRNWDPYLYVDAVLLGALLFVHKFTSGGYNIITTQSVAKLNQFIHVIKNSKSSTDYHIGQGVVYGYQDEDIADFVWPNRASKAMYTVRHLHTPQKRIRKIRNQTIFST